MKHGRSRADTSEKLASAVGRRTARLLLYLYPQSFRNEVGEEVVADHGARAVTVLRERGWMRWGAWFVGSTLALVINAVGAWVDLLGSWRRSIPTFTPATDALLRYPHSGSVMRLPLLDVLRQDLSYTLRGLARSPGFTAVVVVTLALGVGANAAMFSVLSGIFGVPAGLQDPAALRRLYTAPVPSETPDEVPTASSEFNYQEISVIERALGPGGALAAWSEPEEASITRAGAQQAARIGFVSEDFFSVLGVPPVRGRFFADGEGAVDTPVRVAVLSHAFWQKAFAGEPGLVGADVAVDDTTYTVIGIAAAGFRGLDVSATDVFLPLGSFRAQGQPALGLSWYEWGSSYFRLATRLPSASAETELLERATAGYRGQPDIRGYAIDRTSSVIAGPIVEARGPGYIDGAVPISIRIAGVTAVVLLIACANVANLLLLRASRRRREVAVRLALGVSRGRLFRQLVTESVVLATVAGGVACVVGVWGGSILRTVLLPDIEWAQPIVETSTLVLVMLAAAGCGLLAGLVPGLSSLRTLASAALRGGSSASSSRRASALRTGLLVVQGSLSVVLVVGSALFVRSLGRLDALDLGYDTDRLVRAGASGRAADTNPTAIQETAGILATAPGVVGVALASSTPMGGWSSTAIYFENRPTPLTDPSPIYNQVSPQFFEVAGMTLLQGRTFEPGETGVAVVNETLARLIAPGGDAIAQCFRVRSAEAECTRVIAVSEDARRSQILEEQRPQFFLPLADRSPSAILVRFSGDWRPIAALARSELERGFDPGVLRVERMSDALAPQLRPWRLGSQLFTAFGVLALLVTAVGFYSVMAYSVQQRTQEMGVRIALGARVHDVLRLVAGESMGVVVLGIAGGILAALALGRLVASLLYGVTPRDPVAMTAAAAVLLIVGLIASLIPAWRATRVDPVRALAAE